MSIQCMPYGHNTMEGECRETIPDTEFETMERFGWGFVWARDDGAESGRGWFAACPEHADLDPEERRVARWRNAQATGKNPEDRLLEGSVE